MTVIVSMVNFMCSQSQPQALCYGYIKPMFVEQQCRGIYLFFFLLATPAMHLQQRPMCITGEQDRELLLWDCTHTLCQQFLDYFTHLLHFYLG